MRLTDARWPDVESGSRDVLVVPLGALEQHGPHLPLDTDTALAGHVAAEVVRRRDWALAPAIPIGASGEHAAFPGTLSIGTDALAGLLVELVRDAERFWGSVLVVNGHGGNLDALRRAQAVCEHDGRPFAVTHLALPGMDAHAGRSETSLMLFLEPDRVRLELAEPGVTAAMETLRAEGVRALSPNGVLGDPTGATAEEGSRLFERLVSRASNRS